MEQQEATPIISGVMSGDMTAHIRDFLSFAVSSDTHNNGVYYFALIGCSCYLESILEDFTVTWCKVQKHESQDFLQRLLDTIAKDISRATGLDGWKRWTKTLYDIDLAKVAGSDWKTLDILFRLRNQLAHGRTTKFTHFWRSDGRFVGMTLEGSSYEEVFRHLIDQKIVSIPTGGVPSADSILNRKVVMYFHEAVERVISSLRQFPPLQAIGLQ